MIRGVTILISATAFSVGLVASRDVPLTYDIVQVGTNDKVHP